MQTNSPAISSPFVVSKGRLTDTWVGLMVVVFLYLWEGLPMAIAGLPRYYGRQIVAVLIVFMFLLYLQKKIVSEIKFDKWEAMAFLIVSLCFVVSFISNTFIYPQSWSGWVSALYLLCPLFLVSVFRYFGATPRAIIAGLVFAGVSGALIVMMDSFKNISFMDEYERVTTVGLADRRIVFLKTEAAIAATILGSRLLIVRNFRRWFGNLLMAAPVFYSLIFISESRLAIAASMFGMVLFSIFVLKGKTRLRNIALGVVIVIFAVPIVFGKYIEQFTSSNYLEDDASVVYRMLEIEHFRGYFENTHGLGFGIMSTGEGRDNILSFSAHYAGHLYGAGDYGMGVADVGILAALYQFGWLGLALILYVTISSGFYLMRIGRTCKYALDVGAVGAIMIGYMLSPLPMNFFTLDSTSIDGGLLLALCGACTRFYEGKMHSNKGDVS